MLEDLRTTQLRVQGNSFLNPDALGLARDTVAALGTGVEVSAPDGRL